ncbi:disease resistance protein [Corchorus olitorius]|uniref:Disease resistance protein n=1 Tax=Corchorus olitorius TaxID=93759 RepID=A0A1R3KC28_9ROSI|nr:disease resistance protein [Corchorus olitorius]
MALSIKSIGPRFMVKAGMQWKELPGENEWTGDLDKVSLMPIDDVPLGMESHLLHQLSEKYPYGLENGVYQWNGKFLMQKGSSHPFFIIRASDSMHSVETHYLSGICSVGGDQSNSNLTSNSQQPSPVHPPLTSLWYSLYTSIHSEETEHLASETCQLGSPHLAWPTI